MSSILTNNGAMVALQTLKGINASMAKTQSEISTGKSVATAKDNAAIWAISKTMESDVAGFKTISDSLDLGRSTVAVARNAAEATTDLLKQIKTKVIAGTKADISADERSKLQTDINGLKEQIKSVVSSAQFNGQNLLNGAASNPMDVLSSLDRSIDGVTANYISVGTSDLRAEKVSGLASAADDSALGVSADGTAAATVSLGTLTLASSDGTDAAAAADLAAVARTEDNFDANGAVAGDSFTVAVGGKAYSYRIEAGDDLDAVATGLTALISRDFADLSVTADEATGELTLENLSETASHEVSSHATRGLMGTLEAYDVMSEDGAKSFLGEIENLMKSAINTAAAFGSAESRLQIQKDFIGQLTDALKSGIGSMVDANMEEASARLQALQVQQQLATQSLSIANQAPQALLSLFR